MHEGLLILCKPVKTNSERCQMFCNKSAEKVISKLASEEPYMTKAFMPVKSDYIREESKILSIDEIILS